MDYRRGLSPERSANRVCKYAFPDANEQIADIIGEGEKVAARLHFHGTQTGAMGKYPLKFEAIGSRSLAAEPADSDADRWA